MNVVRKDVKQQKETRIYSRNQTLSMKNIRNELIEINE